MKPRPVTAMPRPRPAASLLRELLKGFSGECRSETRSRRRSRQDTPPPGMHQVAYPRPRRRRWSCTAGGQEGKGPRLWRRAHPNPTSGRSTHFWRGPRLAGPPLVALLAAEGVPLPPDVAEELVAGPQRERHGDRQAGLEGVEEHLAGRL